MESTKLRSLPPWELLAKRMIWQQLGPFSQKRILDFGSGEGITACHFAEENDVIAIEPSEESVAARWQTSSYRQIVGSTEKLAEFADCSFDVILCHNVLEYVPNRDAILMEFSRLLKSGGFLSIVKHNCPGRVMQMAVLLNDFDKAHALLSGGDSVAAKYGTIQYYMDDDIPAGCPGTKIQAVYGLRTFWDLQQNQDCHPDPQWQEKMLELENRVSQLEPYRSIAFFHHIILRKDVAPGFGSFPAPPQL